MDASQMRAAGRGIAKRRNVSYLASVPEGERAIGLSGFEDAHPGIEQARMG
jgi:hypothetical protein